MPQNHHTNLRNPLQGFGAVSDSAGDQSAGYTLSLPQDGNSTSGPPSQKLSPEPDGPIDVAGQYSGPASAHSFLGRAIQKFHHGSRPTVLSPPEDAPANVSIFSFGDRKVSDVDPRQLIWPDRTQALELTSRYFDFSSPTYRVLHQGTVEGWVEDCCRPSGQDAVAAQLPNRRVTAATRAILLIICATASMYRPDHSGSMNDADDLGWRQSEIYYQMSEQLQSNETGAPSLGSVQARFLTVLYLLSSSRMSKAWYVFGTAVQLLMALGLHRKQKPLVPNAPSSDRIEYECRKRVFWCSFTLDKYISLMLGRPRLLQESDNNQELPDMVNDEDLNVPVGSAPQRGRDCTMAASVFHADLSTILTEAAKDIYALQPTNAARQVEIIVRLTGKVDAWHHRLPPTLSGAIHPSSLIPIFRRQLTVLQLARDHALMFITRPLLLRNFAQLLPDKESIYRQHLNVCVKAARDTVELALYFVREEKLFSAFWYTQYIVFNALSVIYIYLIQVQRGRIPTSLTIEASGTTESSTDELTTLNELADTAQHHLERATIKNAPLWRYSAILQGLRSEIHRLLHHDATSTSNGGAHNQSSLYTTEQNHVTQLASTSGVWARNDQRLAPDSTAGVYDMANFPSYDNLNDNPMQQNLDPMLSGFNYFDSTQMDIFDSLSTGDDLRLDFWTQMDGFPTCMSIRFGISSKH